MRNASGFTIALLAASASLAVAKPPALDPGFGKKGVVTLRTIDGLFDEDVVSLAEDRRGRILAGVHRHDRNSGTGTSFVLLRLTPQGAVDATFGTQGVLDLTSVMRIREVAVDSQGRIVLAGSTPYDPQSTHDDDVRVVRLSEDGAVDPTFGTAGVATRDVLGTDVADVLVLDAADRPVVGVNSYHLLPAVFENQYEGRVLRFTTSGAPDASFGSNGIAADSAMPEVVEGLSLDGSTIVYVGPRTQRTYTKFRVGRLLGDGTPDPAFGTGGHADFENANTWLGRANGVAVDASHRVVVAGEDYGISFDDVADAIVLRFTPAGVLDAAFGDAGTLHLDPSQGGYDQGVRIGIPDGGAGPYVLSGEMTTSQRHAHGWFLLEVPQAGGAPRFLRRPISNTVAEVFPGAMEFTRGGAALFGGAIDGNPENYQEGAADDVYVARVQLTPSGAADLSAAWTARPVQKCKPDGRCTLKGTVSLANSGGTDAPSASLRVYLSDDDVLDAADTLLVDVPTGPLKVLASKKKSFHATLPASAAGRRVLAVLDEANAVPEKDDANVAASDPVN